MSAPWKTEEPPHDGTLIVAIGRVIYEFSAGPDEDDLSSAGPVGTAVDPFLANIRWTEEPGQSKGWHFESGMSVATTLDDEIKIDFWLEAPQ